MSAYREGDKTIVLLPSSLTKAEEEYEIARILERLEGRERRRRAPEADEDLLDRSKDLSRRFLNGRARPSSVRWVDNQRSRWGSCTPDDRTIRISTMLKSMPAWVVDYVLIHELAHLIEPGHNAAFWNLVAAYPKTERARGYLEGVSAAANLGTAEDFHEGEPGEIDFGATG